jgi:hypothetical protein
LAGMLQNQNAWIHEYFHGARARAAEQAAPAAPDAAAPGAAAPDRGKDSHG